MGKSSLNPDTNAGKCMRLYTCIAETYRECLLLYSDISHVCVCNCISEGMAINHLHSSSLNLEPVKAAGGWRVNGVRLPCSQERLAGSHAI